MIKLTFLFFLNGMIKRSLNTFVTPMTLTDVNVEQSDISIFSGKGQLLGVSIGNPEGFHTGNAFKLDDIKIQLKLPSLFSNRIIIEEILLNCPEFTYEMNGTTTNIQTILDNIEMYSENSKKGNVNPTNTAKNADGKKVQINRLILKGGKINIGTTVIKGKTITLPLPEITLNDIGKEKGKRISDAFEEVFKAVNQNITSVISDSSMLLDQGIQLAGQGAKFIDRTTQKVSNDLKEFLRGNKT
jgi:hypothetical protein